MLGRSINSLSVPSGLSDDPDDLTIDTSLMERTLRVLTSSASELEFESGKQRKVGEGKYRVAMFIIIILFFGVFLALFVPTMMKENQQEKSGNFNHSETHPNHLLP